MQIRYYNYDCLMLFEIEYVLHFVEPFIHYLE